MGIFQKIKTVNKVMSIPVEYISPNPNQPRHEFDKESLEQLAASIAENGLLQPVTVRKTAEDRYELIAGERRLRACSMLGFKEIAAIVSDMGEYESAMLSIIENIQRRELNFFEEAMAYRQLIEKFGMTQEQVAEKLGKAQSTVANKLRLERLSDSLKSFILENNLSERHARALLKVDDEELAMECAKIIAVRGLNVQQSESYIEKRINEEPQAQTTLFGGARIFVVKDFRIFVNSINRAVEVMKGAGISADSYQTEHDGYVEYIVRVPKSQIHYSAKSRNSQNNENTNTGIKTSDSVKIG